MSIDMNQKILTGLLQILHENVGSEEDLLNFFVEFLIHINVLNRMEINLDMKKSC